MPPTSSVTSSWSLPHCATKSFFFFVLPVRDVILRSVSVPQSPKRHYLSSSTFWPQHRSSYERKVCQRMRVARAVAHGPERLALREKRSAGSRLFGAASSNARVDRNLRASRRRSCPWNQPKVCWHWRLRRQYLTAMSWPGAFTHTEFLAIQRVRIGRA